MSLIESCLTFLNAGNPLGARRLIEELPDFQGRGPAISELYAVILAECKEFDLAYSEFSLLTQKSDATPQAIYNFGKLLVDYVRQSDVSAGGSKTPADYQTKRIDTLVLAKTLFRRAIEKDPGYKEAWTNLAGVLFELRQYVDALELYKKQLKNSPGDNKLLYMTALCYAEQKDHQRAINILERVLLCRNDDAAAWHAKAVSELSVGFHESAYKSLERALLLSPDNNTYRITQATLLQGVGRITEAKSILESIVGVDPGNARAHWNLSLCLLTLGDYQRGWREYEWRWRLPAFSHVRRFIHSKQWDGERLLPGDSLFIFSEQGLGDNLQFVRFALKLSETLDCVTLQVPDTLLRLYSAHEWPLVLVADSDPVPRHSHSVALMGIPLRLGVVLDEIPYPQGYLTIKPLSAQPPPTTTRPMRIGIVWQGGRGDKLQLNRSLELSLLLKFLPADCVYVTLQKEISPEDLDILARCANTEIRCNEIADFYDTALICCDLDLVISIDTSIPHLAAALGIETWVLLTQYTDFRWLQNTNLSPWYSAVRLYRQQSDEDWVAPLTKINSDLRDRMNKQKQASYTKI